jgi:hypothetical protein
MPRIRTLKPEHKGHRHIGPLSDRAYRLWVGLVTEADDEGRLACDVRHFRSVIFSYQTISAPKVQAALDEILATDSLRRYEVQGAAYLYFPSWHEHQKIDRPKVSTLPAPSDIRPTPVSREKYDRSPIPPRNATGRRIRVTRENDSPQVDGIRRTIDESSTSVRPHTDPIDRSIESYPTDLPPEGLSAPTARTRIRIASKGRPETGPEHIRAILARVAPHAQPPPTTETRMRQDQDQGHDQDQDRTRSGQVQTGIPTDAPVPSSGDLPAPGAADDATDDPSVTGRPRVWGDLVRFGYGAGNVGAEAA